MSAIQLPPLPWPHVRPAYGPPLFTADQLRADRLAVAQAVRDACAKVCDEIENGHRIASNWHALAGAAQCGDAIAALKIEGANDADQQ